MIATLAYPSISETTLGSTRRAVFEAYVERVPAPSPSLGQVVVVDNPGARRGWRIRKLVEAKDCELPFLPPYSPDFSPIEEAFSKAEACGREALVEVIGRALSAVTVGDARCYFGHCGYPLDAQPS